MCLRSKEYKDKDKLRKTRNEQRKRYYAQTQGHKKRKWSEEEIELLIETKMTDKELANQLNRSIQSIQCKRYGLKVNYAN